FGFRASLAQCLGGGPARVRVPVFELSYEIADVRGRYRPHDQGKQNQGEQLFHADSDGHCPCRRPRWLITHSQMRKLKERGGDACSGRVGTDSAGITTVLGIPFTVSRLELVSSSNSGKNFKGRKPSPAARHNSAVRGKRPSRNRCRIWSVVA